MPFIDGVHVCRVWFVACVLFVGAANADPLSLQEAVALAAAEAPQVAAQRAMVEAADASVISAGRLPDPELMLGLENAPVEGPDAWSLDADFMTMRTIGVMQSVPNARKRSSQKDRAAAVAALARNQKQQTQLEVARATAEAWIDVYVAEQTLDHLRSLEPQIKLQAEAARAALASGRGDTFDALAAQSAISEWSDRVLRARRDLHHFRAELARWIGDHAARPLGAPPEFHSLPLVREQLLALHRHTELQQFDARIAVARSEVELARAEKRPDWSVQLAYGDRGPAFDDMASIEFRMGLPLFSRTRQDPMIAARRAEIAQIEAEREMELRMHDAGIRSEIAAWEAARERIQLYESERLPLARRQTQAALAGLQAGRVQLMQVLASQVAEIEAHRDYVEVIGELGRAWAALRYLEAEHLD